MAELHRASISTGYRWRLALFAAGCLAFSAWCFYDGYVAYPRRNKIVEQFHQYKIEHSDWEESWPKYALEKGLPTEPKDELKTDSDITLQYVMMGLTLPIGLLFGFAYLRSGGRWIAADEQSLYTSWKQRVPLEAIKTLNKERWRAKGIAVVKYVDPANKTERTLILDDWKYDRAPTTLMVELVEQSLTPEQVIGDTGPLVELPAPDASDGDDDGGDDDADVDDEQQQAAAQGDDTSAADDDEDDVPKSGAAPP